MNERIYVPFNSLLGYIGTATSLLYLTLFITYLIFLIVIPHFHRYRFITVFCVLHAVLIFKTVLRIKKTRIDLLLLPTGVSRSIAISVTTYFVTNSDLNILGVCSGIVTEYVKFIFYTSYYYIYCIYITKDGRRRFCITSRARCRT